jgi:hypothetical protein
VRVEGNVGRKGMEINYGIIEPRRGEQRETSKYGAHTLTWFNGRKRIFNYLSEQRCILLRFFF